MPRVGAKECGASHFTLGIYRYTYACPTSVLSRSAPKGNPWGYVTTPNQGFVRSGPAGLAGRPLLQQPRGSVKGLRVQDLGFRV